MPNNNQVTMSRADYDMMRTVEETYNRLIIKLQEEHDTVVRQVEESGALYAIESYNTPRGSQYKIRVLDEDTATRLLEKHLPTLRRIKILEEALQEERNAKDPEVNATRKPKWWDFLVRK